MVSRVRPYCELGVAVFVSHTTAAALHGIPIPSVFESEPFIHLTRPKGCSLPRRKGIRGHQCALGGDETTLFSGLPITTLARTWLDLAQLLPLEDLVVAGDHLICGHQRGFGRSQNPRVSLTELREYVGATRGRPGLAKARQALTMMRVGVDSPPETRLRLMLWGSNLPDFVPNFPVEGDYGTPPVWVDLACAEFKVCAEYEGRHHLTPHKQASDRRRDSLTAEMGWLQVKIYARDMEIGEEWVIGFFVQALQRHGWQGPH